MTDITEKTPETERPILRAADLMQFTGTERWFRHALVRDVLHTEGVQYLAERGGAYWLIDEIALAQRTVAAVKGEEFQVWTLKVFADRRASLACEDGNGRSVHAKTIAFTDFPLEEITLYFTGNVILLPSEY